jgi:ribose transport system permease protein
MTLNLKSPGAVVPELSQKTSFEKWRERLGGGWILLLLVVLLIVFTVLRPDQFATAFNISTLATDAALLLVMAIGQAFVIMTAGIDLSVGSVLVFSSVTSSLTMLALSGASSSTYGQTNANSGIIGVGVVVAIGSGALWGIINGLLVSRTRVPALIVTLGTMGMALGAAQLLTNGQDVRGVPKLLVTWVGAGQIAGIPLLILIAVVIAVVAAITLRKTRFGTWTLATGSNEEAARRSGVNVRAQLLKVYTLSGALAGVAGIMAVARFSTTTIAGHSQDNLATISAVVLGGTSLFGGVGTILGTVIGVFIPVILLNGFIILGIPPFWQTVAMGAVLIIAVYIDQTKRQKRTLK